MARCLFHDVSLIVYGQGRRQALLCPHLASRHRYACRGGTEGRPVVSEGTLTTSGMPAVLACLSGHALLLIPHPPAFRWMQQQDSGSGGGGSGGCGQGREAVLSRSRHQRQRRLVRSDPHPLPIYAGHGEA